MLIMASAIKTFIDNPGVPLPPGINNTQELIRTDIHMIAITVIRVPSGISRGASMYCRNGAKNRLRISLSSSQGQLRAKK